MRRYYVGLDVHSKNSAFVIEDAGGRVIAKGEVPTTPEGFWGLCMRRISLQRERRSLWRPGRWRSSSPVSSVDSGSIARGAAQGTPTWA